MLNGGLLCKTDAVGNCINVNSRLEYKYYIGDNIWKVLLFVDNYIIRIDVKLFNSCLRIYTFNLY